MWYRILLLLTVSVFSGPFASSTESACSALLRSFSWVPRIPLVFIQWQATRTGAHTCVFINFHRSTSTWQRGCTTKPFARQPQQGKKGRGHPTQEGQVHVFLMCSRQLFCPAWINWVMVVVVVVTASPDAAVPLTRRERPALISGANRRGTLRACGGDGGC